jgi:hypothetical protein
MNTKIKISFGCYFLAILILAAFGVTYFFRNEFLPYHAIAVGMPWAEVAPSFRVLIIALMRGVGGACLAVVVLELVLLFVPFRQGVAWARWAITTGGLVVSAGALYAMIYVALNKPAKPPWIAVVVAALLLVVGLLFSQEQQERADAGAE